MRFVGWNARELLSLAPRSQAAQGFAPYTRRRVKSSAIRTPAYADLSEYALYR